MCAAPKRGRASRGVCARAGVRALDEDSSSDESDDDDEEEEGDEGGKGGETNGKA